MMVIRHWSKLSLSRPSTANPCQQQSGLMHNQPNGKFHGEKSGDGAISQPHFLNVNKEFSCVRHAAPEKCLTRVCRCKFLAQRIIRRQLIFSKNTVG